MVVLENLSFEEFYKKYYETAFRYILKKVSNVHTAEDLVMDCFISAYKKFSCFDSNKASYGTWLFVIVNNRLKNYYRDNKLFDEIDETLMLSDDFTDELIAAKYIGDLRQVLYEALLSLNEIQRQIVIYKFFYEKNSKEISEIIGIPSGSIRVQLSRAIKKLRDYFEKKGINWEE